MCLCVSVSLCVRVFVPMFICMYIHLCVRVFVHACMYLWACVTKIVLYSPGYIKKSTDYYSLWKLVPKLAAVPGAVLVAKNGENGMEVEPPVVWELFSLRIICIF